MDNYTAKLLKTKDNRSTNMTVHELYVLLAGATLIVFIGCGKLSLLERKDKENRD